MIGRVTGVCVVLLAASAAGVGAAPPPPPVKAPPVVVPVQVPKPPVTPPPVTPQPPVRDDKGDHGDKGEHGDKGDKDHPCDNGNHNGDKHCGDNGGDGGGGGGPASSLTANVWVSRAGIDSCTRSATPLTLAAATGHICKHWDAAYRAASSAANDVVRVVDGVYESTYWTTGAIDRAQDLDSYLIRNDPAKTSGTVTFTCGTPGSVEGVTFANGFSVIEGSRLTIDGGGNWRTGTKSCFRFRALLTGWTGDPSSADNLTIEGIHAGGILVIGSQTSTVQGNEIGPFVSCHDSTWPIANERCRNEARDDEKYWFDRNEGPAAAGTPGQTQYLSKDNCATAPTNMTWADNWLHDENGLGDNGEVTHTGQLQNGDPVGCPGTPNGVTFARNRFERNIVAGLAPSASEDNVTIENNFFGEAAAPATGGSCVPTVNCGTGMGFCIDANTGWGDGTGTNWVIRFNVCADGLRLPGVFAKAAVYGNLLETTAPTCGTLTYSYNVWANGSAPCPGANQPTSTKLLLNGGALYSASSSYDYTLAGAPGSTPADGLVPVSVGCPATDNFGNRRPAAGTSCDAGATER